MKTFKKILVPWNSRQYACMFMFSLLLLTTLFLLFPQQAHAGIVEDAMTAVQNGFKEIINSAITSTMNFVKDVSNFFDAKEALNASFNSILTRGHGESTAYRVIEAMQKTVTIVGQSILAFALLMQLIKISQRIDGSATLPVVKEIAILAVFFVVGSWLVNHSFEICTAIYDGVNDMTNAILNSGKIPGREIDGFTFSNDKDLDAGGLIIILFAWLIVAIFSLIGSVIALALIMARAIQLYVMAACSPIPLSLLMFDETRQMGIGFLKSFAAVCLAGTILAILIMIYPSLVLDILSASAVDNNNGVWVIKGDSVGQFVPVLACSFMYIYALMKSGSWARDVLGG